MGSHPTPNYIPGPLRSLPKQAPSVAVSRGGHRCVVVSRGGRRCVAVSRTGHRGAVPSSGDRSAAVPFSGDRNGRCPLWETARRRCLLWETPERSGNVFLFFLWVGGLRGGRWWGPSHTHTMLNYIGSNYVTPNGVPPRTTPESPRAGLRGWQLAGFGKRGPHRGPPRNHPGEAVYPRETPGIASSRPEDNIGGVSGNACADSGLKSLV